LKKRGSFAEREFRDGERVSRRRESFESLKIERERSRERDRERERSREEGLKKDGETGKKEKREHYLRWRRLEIYILVLAVYADVSDTGEWACACEG